MDVSESERQFQFSSGLRREQTCFRFGSRRLVVLNLVVNFSVSYCLHYITLLHITVGYKIFSVGGFDL